MLGEFSHKLPQRGLRSHVPVDAMARLTEHAAGVTKEEGHEVIRQFLGFDICEGGMP
jgi:hypothetical protein